MKIGQAITDLDKPEEEQARIMKSVVSGVGRPSDIYSQYSPLIEEHSFWRFAQRALRITGFRPGKAKKQVLISIQNGIKNNNIQATNVFWETYLNSVITYLRKEHPNLDKLLLEQEFEADPDSSNDLIQSVKLAAPIYDVTNTQIEEFYEIYWFTRLKNLDDILKSKSVSFEVVEALISKSERTQLKRISELKAGLNKLELNKNPSLKRIRGELVKLERKIDHIKEDLSLDVTKLEKQFLETIEYRVAELEKQNARDIESEDKRSLENIVTQNQENIDRLNKKLIQLSQEKKKRKHKNRSNFIANAREFICNIQGIYGLKDLNEKHVAVLNELLRFQGAYYVESDSIMSSFCQEQLKEKQVNELVLTPSKVEFTAHELQDFSNYDVLYLKNVSACFIEGVVIPLLLKSNSVVKNDFPKVFVETDSKLNSNIELEIRTHAIDLSYTYLKELGTVSCESELNQNSNHCDSLESKVDIEELIKLFETAGVYLEYSVLNRLKHYTDILSKYTEQSELLSIALKMVAIPYIESRYGKNKVLVILELVNGLYKQ